MQESPPIINKNTLRVWSAIQSTFTQIHFWFWNLLFVFVSLLVILPHVFTEVFAAFFTGQLPAGIFFSLVGLFLIPIVSLVVGATNVLHQRFLLKFFYAVELPAITLLILRSTALKQTPLPATIFLMLCFLAIVGTAVILWREKAGKTTDDRLSSVIVTLALWSGITMGGIGVVTNLPMILGMMSNFMWSPAVFPMAPVIFLVAIFSLMSIIVYFLLPPMYLWITIQNWIKWGREGRVKVRLITSGIAVLALSIGFYAASTLTQNADLRILDQATSEAGGEPQSRSDYRKMSRALVNSYLNIYRYPYNTDDIDFQSSYREMTGTDAFLLSAPSNTIVNYLAAPFIYLGEDDDGARAELAYAEVFDSVIQKDHRRKVKSAMSARFEPSTAEAGLLELEEKNVSVVEQRLTVVDRGSWADVELYEVYENNTFQSQEVFYYFSLPEHAAIKGLYLGTTPQKERAFSHRVSPRGAAQQVYKEQRVKNVDPALLEQVGPHQYRLRVFPIPAKQRDFETINVEIDRLYLWMELEIVKSTSGEVLLPTLLEKRNTHLVKNRKRTQKIQADHYEKQKWDKEGWLPKAVKLTASERSEPLVLDGFSINLHKTAPKIGNVDQKVVAIFESSYSMSKHRREARNTFDHLRNADVPCYLSTSSGLAEMNSHRDLKPHGKMELTTVMNQYLNRGMTGVDHVIIVTDEGGYEVSSDKKLIHEWTLRNGRLNILHLGGRLAPAYPDAVADALAASRGRVSTKLSDLTMHRGAPEVMELLHPEAESGHPLPAAVAARLIINHLSEGGNQSRQDLERLHAIAKKHEVVTPYSSMIVLVNSRQERRLDELEKKRDKFARETDTGVATIRANQQQSFINGSVPEPSSVMLLIISAFAALGVRRRR